MNENISPISIEEKMKKSYLNYSLSVIVGRALPDVYDGLKPVHRRILYAASEMGLVHNKGHKKSARIVGEVLGKYHPHGDAAVYDAMVRMAQNFNQRYPLIDGHGNFGSIDGDSPAAMRYTEARLTEIAEESLKDIKSNTINFNDNFDGTLKEPEVLPTRIPNLLINGSSGIAVGMSTSIPPHNLIEIIDALIHLIKQPKAKLMTLMNYIKGPDFSTGANILGKEEILKAYKTGKGKITLRAKANIEKTASGRKEQIIVTEIPYQLNKAKLIEEIAELVNKGKIENVSDLRDETDQNGMRIVIELKNGSDSGLILNQLYKYSKLQTNFRINLLALINNKPRVMNLKEILTHFIEFRKNIYTRKTKFNLNKAREKYHILKGLKKAIDKLDMVINIIRNSQSKKEANTKLTEKLTISEKQANAILEMRLQRLVGLEIKKLEKEINKLKKDINTYTEILENESLLNKKIINEMNEIKIKYGDNRKTKIIENVDEKVITKKDLIKKKNAIITLSYRFNIKRTDDFTKIKTGKDDYINYITGGSSYDTLLFFTTAGNTFTYPVHKLPEHHGLSTGDLLNDFIQLPLKEKLINMICLNKNIKENYITIITKQGLVKKTPGKEYETSYTNIKSIKLHNNDKVVDVIISNGNSELLLGTQKGKVIRFHEESVNATGRNTLGSKGIKLEKNDKVITANKIINNKEKYIISLSIDGKGNRANIKEFKLQNRYGKGNSTILSDNYNLSRMILADKNDNLIIKTDNNKIHSLKINKIPEVEIPGYMYNILKLDKNNKIIKASINPIK